MLKFAFVTSSQVSKVTKPQIGKKKQMFKNCNKSENFFICYNFLYSLLTPHNPLLNNCKIAENAAKYCTSLQSNYSRYKENHWKITNNFYMIFFKTYNFQSFFKLMWRKASQTNGNEGRFSLSEGVNKRTAADKFIKKTNFK